MFSAPSAILLSFGVLGATKITPSEVGVTSGELELMFLASKSEVYNPDTELSPCAYFGICEVCIS